MQRNVGNVLEVLRRAGYSAAHWKELGQRLAPPHTDLDAIEENFRWVEDRLEAVVSSWLRDGDLIGGEGGGGAWEVLATTVERCRRGGGRNVAAKIRDIASSSSPGDVLDSRPAGMESDQHQPLSLDSKPTRRQLNSLVVNDSEIRIIQTIAPLWETVGLQLHLSSSTINVIRRDHSSPAYNAFLSGVLSRANITASNREMSSHLKSSYDTVFKLLAAEDVEMSTDKAIIIFSSYNINCRRLERRSTVIDYDIQDSMRCCEVMLERWLSGRQEMRRPLTWRTLAEALRDTGEFDVLANQIETTVNNVELM